MDTKRAQKARNLQLTKEQQEIVIGTLLGDGYLDATTRGFALRINHGIMQKAYVDWKYQKLKVFTNSPPRQSARSYYFRTVTHSYFSDLRKSFYHQHLKVLPINLLNWLTPLVLGVWIMDDGAKDYHQLRINTQSFSQEENGTIISILKAKLGINATLNRDKNRFRLRISANSMSSVRQLVAPYILPSMRYKLSL